MEPAPFHIDPGRDGGGAPLVAGKAVWRRAADGVRLRLALWPWPWPGDAAPVSLKGTVLLMPGRTEYVEKYAATASALAARGYATISVDWRGQGLADRLLPDRTVGHVDRFSDYQRDVAVMTDLADAAGLPHPWYLIAHSMGGCIGLRAILSGLPVRAAVFSAPMWGIAMRRIDRPAAWMLTALRRFRRIGSRYVPSTGPVTYVAEAPYAQNTLTSDRQMFEMMRAQVRSHPELSVGGPSISWLGEALREMRRLRAARAPDLPSLTMIGSGDRIVDHRSVAARMDRWPGGRLNIIVGAEHELLMETPDRRDAFLDSTETLFDRVR